MATAQIDTKTIYEQLNKMALEKGETAEEEQDNIDEFNQERIKNNLKKLSWTQYMTVQANYFRTHYGVYTAAASGLMLATVYLGAMALNPALIPFGMAALTGYLKYAVAAAFVTLAAASGAYFFPRTYAEVINLQERVNDQDLSNYDTALLGSTVVLGSAFVSALFLMPSLLPFVGTLSTIPKLATAASAAAPTALAAYALFKARPSKTPEEGKHTQSNQMGVGDSQEGAEEEEQQKGLRNTSFS